MQSIKRFSAIGAATADFSRRVLCMKVLLTILFGLSSSVLAQSMRQPTVKSALCTQESAVHMINQQIVAAKTLENSVQRITLLVRAADLLWSYQPEKSRATFADAFELAKQNYNAEGDAPSVLVAAC